MYEFVRRNVHVPLFIFFFLIQIIDEADLDNDDGLSFAEFEHKMTKNPEFVT